MERVRRHARIQGRGQAKLPARLRRRLGLKAEDEVAIQGPGYAELYWTDGPMTFTLTASFAPGHESFAPLVQMARTLDARYRHHPLP
jgi:hypothetical protein